MKLDKVGQVGVVVKDVEAAAKFLGERFGIGPFHFVDFKNGKAVYKGEERAYKSKVGMCNYNGLVLELMQPYEGETIQNDPQYLPPGGQGLHHLGFYVPDAEALVQEFEKDGGRVLQRSWPMPNAMTIYLSTPQYSGILIELIQLGAPQK
jgi:catechol 2,3-dioxygenase-like lactoylglutathione lyase family enzyme